MEYPTGRILRGFLLLSAALAASACATARGKFTPTMKENVGVFADQTVAMLSQADFGFTRSEAIYTRTFFDPEGEEEKGFFHIRDSAKDAFRAIIIYSFRLVLIAEANDTEKKKVGAYADYLSGFDDRILEDLRFGKNHYAGLIQEIRGKETFIDALKAAQPIINAAGQHINQILDNIVVSANALASKMEQKIDAEYVDVIRYQKILETEKYAVFTGLEQLYLTRKGDEDAFDRFVKSRVLRSEKLLPKGPPSGEDLDRLRESLLRQLDDINRIWLDELHAKTLENINRARMISLLWVRAHQKMGLGTINPAEWIDVQDLIRLGVKFF
jgi:hypothetical protein